MPRLFTGLEVPSDIAERIASLRGGLPSARWIDPENYHITLRFIGDIDDATAEEIAEALARIWRPALSIVLDGLSSFGGRQPHSVIAKVAATSALLELQAEQERLMQRLGLAPEGRKFSPHVTLARVKGASAGAVARWLDARGGFQAGPFRAERFVLFSSRASTGGGPYLVEADYPLTA